MTNEDNRKRAVMYLNKSKPRKLFKDVPRGFHIRLMLFIFGSVVALIAAIILFGRPYFEAIDLWADNIVNQVMIISGLWLVMAGFGVWAIWFRKR